MKNRTVFFYFLVLLFFVSCASTTKELVILHTNDTHSQVEPNNIIAGNQYSGLGGYARRAAFIDSVRTKNRNVLLLDAGDFLQGTPFFNFFKGDLEAKAYRAMRYDAVTLGNHEFDNGVAALDRVLLEMDIPVVCVNYSMTGTALDSLVTRFKIFERGGLKIGVFGVGVNPNSLIAEQNFKDISYIEPVVIANYYADFLKGVEKCDLVICLSHLGNDTKNSIDGMSDSVLVRRTRNIDLVIGGHSHELIDRLRVPNLDGDSIPVVQAGRTGAYIGEVKILFKRGK
ncbi:MAG: metallophosphatase [Prevotellaceae bacterium]|jgi:5'-nucleotidase|nr:metallophosphatase [Prevotellaceae bacterium]